MQTEEQIQTKKKNKKKRLVSIVSRFCLVDFWGYFLVLTFCVFFLFFLSKQKQ